MSIRERMIDYSKGDSLYLFWKLFRFRERYKPGILRNLLTFLLYRMAHRHGGYIGNGARFDAIPSLPHGLHGIFISRYAQIGTDCRIYQNVTIGEVNRLAPRIGHHCMIGAGAILIGDIQIGDHVKIGAGAVVCTDIPDNTTVVPQPSRILIGRNR